MAVGVENGCVEQVNSNIAKDILECNGVDKKTMNGKTSNSKNGYAKSNLSNGVCVSTQLQCS